MILPHAKQQPEDAFDIVVVGAGVIGLAVARELALHYRGSRSIVVIEGEDGFGRHTSSRNSEVIHAGLYYPADSAKASLCLNGRELLYRYCEDNAVSYSKIGKLVVAQADQLAELEVLERRASANGVTDLEEIPRSRLRQWEPALSAEAALFSPSTGIIDSHAYMQSLLDDAQKAGALFAHSTRVSAGHADEQGFVLTTLIREGAAQHPYSLRARVLINCAGLEANGLAAALLQESRPEAKPPTLQMSKGSYFTYQGKNPFSHLIYPLPDQSNDALGIHATIDLSGGLRFGPDAEACQVLDYSVDPAKRDAFARAIARFFPSLDKNLLVPGYAGIRPKREMRDGGPSDFLIRSEVEAGLPRLINLLAIESPGLTASLAIAKEVGHLVQGVED
jgi:L-2-hydroxyglutarate oxidase LhgO